MKNNITKLNTLLANLDRNCNLEYIDALAQQIADNQDLLNRLTQKPDESISLAMMKYEVNRLGGRNEVLVNMISKLIDESNRIQAESVALLFEMMKESIEE